VYLVLCDSADFLYPLFYDAFTSIMY